MNAALMKQMMALYGKASAAPGNKAGVMNLPSDDELLPMGGDDTDQYRGSPDFSQMGGQLASELGAVRQGRGLSDRVFLDQQDNGVGGFVDNADQLFNAPVPRGAREGDYVKDPRRRR